LSSLGLVDAIQNHRHLPNIALPKSLPVRRNGALLVHLISMQSIHLIWCHWIEGRANRRRLCLNALNQAEASWGMHELALDWNMVQNRKSTRRFISFANRAQSSEPNL